MNDYEQQARELVGYPVGDYADVVRRIAAALRAARADEREACARIAESCYERAEQEPETNGFESAMAYIAAAIRARRGE